MINPYICPGNHEIMLNSLYLYARNISSLVFRQERNIALTDMYRYYRQGKQRFFTHSQPATSREEALQMAMQWLLLAHERMNDGGIGSYHLVDGWSSSYPETSGYIIPTLIVYGGLTGDDRYIDAAMDVAEWLLSIQKTSGGWQGGRVNENQPEIVFNTGQVMRGMLSAYAQSKDEKYIRAAVRAGDWLCQVQDPQGYWKRHALMEQERVYDSYVDLPLLMLAEASADRKYADHAVRNLDWIIKRKQHENGWFEDCDNTVRHNDRPILHTIAYTIDGLLDAGIRLNDERYKTASIAPAARLRDLFLASGFLHGRYDAGWKGSEYMIATGCAQMSIIWLKLYVLTGDQDFCRAAEQMNDLLVRIQQRGVREEPNTRGAIPGSFPIWGKYEPFAFPNWATKFFSDALLLEQHIHLNRESEPAQK